MPKDKLVQLIRHWEIAYKTCQDYRDQFFGRTFDGQMVKWATKIMDRAELDKIARLEQRERSLRKAWEQALQ